MSGHPSQSPGVYLEQASSELAPGLQTGVPAFIGTLRETATGAQQSLSLDLPAWAYLEQRHGTAWAEGLLGYAVRGFFENGGQRCYVLPLGASGLEGALDELSRLDGVDLVCAPGLEAADSAARTAAQARILQACSERGDCFAILDSPLCTGTSAQILDQVKAYRDTLDAAIKAFAGGNSGALYFPWLEVPAGDGRVLVPPCGHIAGVYSRVDGNSGFHKAPANEALEGVSNLQVALSSAGQETLASGGGPAINCLRAFTGRGMRIWGARTLSRDPAWCHVNVRRTVLTIRRWLELVMSSMVFEPNDLKLWIRIGREVGAFLEELHRRGALKGAVAEEAFYVKCDAETNPQQVRELGQVVTEIGLAPVTPSEFLVVRLVQSADGVALAGAA
ncbi:phage tail sheath family protein [Pyxidicoccus sp. 3LG]